MMICAPALQTPELPLVGLAAVDRQFAHAALEKRELRNFFRDLHGELARRAKDQHLRRAETGVDHLNRRNAERGGLAGAGLRLADDVRAFEQDGNGRGLNGRSFFKAHPLDRLQDLRRKSRVRRRVSSA